MNAVLAPERLPATWPEPYDGMAVREAAYWEVDRLQALLRQAGIEP